MLLPTVAVPGFCPPAADKHFGFFFFTCQILLSHCLDSGHLSGVRQHLILLWAYILMIISDAEHFFMCLLVNCMTPLEKCEKSDAHMLPSCLPCSYGVFMVLSALWVLTWQECVLRVFCCTVHCSEVGPSLC